LQTEEGDTGGSNGLSAAGAFTSIRGDEQMDDIYAINLAKTIIREGFNEGNTERVLSIYDDAFADMSFSMPSFYYSDAKDVFRARLNRLFRDYAASMKVIIIDVVVNGDRAFDWGWHVLDLTSRIDGITLQVRTRYFETWRRDTARGWIVTSFIDNLDQVPRMPEEVIQEISTSDDNLLATRQPRDLLQFSAPAKP